MNTLCQNFPAAGAPACMVVGKAQHKVSLVQIEGATTWRRRSLDGDVAEYIGVAALSHDELLIFSTDAATCRALGSDGTGNVPTDFLVPLGELVTSDQATGLQRFHRSEIIEVGFVQGLQQVRVTLAGRSPVVLAMASSRHAVRVGATLGQALFPGRESRLECVEVTGMRPGGRFARKTKPLVVLALCVLVVAQLTHTDRFAKQAAQGNSNPIQTVLAAIPLWVSYVAAAAIVAFAAYEFKKTPVPTHEVRSWSAEPPGG